MVLVLEQLIIEHLTWNGGPVQRLEKQYAFRYTWSADRPIQPTIPVSF
jgi:hypothetical protein